MLEMWAGEWEMWGLVVTQRGGGQEEKLLLPDLHSSENIRQARWRISLWPYNTRQCSKGVM